MNKLLQTSLACLALLFLHFQSKAMGHTFYKHAETKIFEDTQVNVEYPEVYELANIVLALTEYGRNAPYEVQKNFPYYAEIIDYFKPVMGHPLLKAVNFSREKWDQYLSFRTDAYAFAYDEKGRIKRVNNFHSFWRIKAFDKNLELVQDFSDKSNFRQFYASHAAFYERVKTEYAKYFMIAEMRDFLYTEFPDASLSSGYSVVLSGLVGGQNLHRAVTSKREADFVPVPRDILKGTKSMNRKTQAREIHTLFTEMDHAFVNPITSIWKKKVKKEFREQSWDSASGYGGYKVAVFNEYMTWAVYDLFTRKYFPEYADEINLYWHFQNDSRGFIYSAYFSRGLAELYQNKPHGQSIRDLYPDLLDWCDSQNLTKPNMISPVDTLGVEKGVVSIWIRFSEPMRRVEKLSAVLNIPGRDKDTLYFSPQANHLMFGEKNTLLSFEMDVPDVPFFSLEFNSWGTPIPLESAKGVLLSAYSTLNFKVSP